MPAPRKRFQIHLSTAILLMFGSGLLIFANISSQSTFTKSIRNPEIEPFYMYHSYGWPWQALLTVKEARIENGKMVVLYSGSDAHSYRNGILDAGLALLILFAIGYAGERWIGRRDKTETPNMK